MKDRPVTIIGGGSVALRKFKTLINEGAKVKVVAKDFIDCFMDQGAELIKDVYKKEYIEGAFCSSSQVMTKSSMLRLRWMQKL